LVVDAMTGQDAVHMAQAFSEQMDFTGVFLTKLDGDARGGAALSVRAVTGRPIKFVGVGERTDDIEPFHPDRMASRILGMGDVATLVEKVERAVGEEQVRRAKKEEFTLEDFLEQIRQVRKMGPLDQLLGMLPGAGKALKGLQVDEGELARAEAIVLSMTPQERRNPHIIDGSRRRRIARGSGTSVQEVNQLLGQFFALQKLAKQVKKGKLKGFPGRLF